MTISIMSVRRRGITRRNRNLRDLRDLEGLRLSKMKINIMPIVNPFRSMTPKKSIGEINGRNASNLNRRIRRVIKSTLSFIVKKSIKLNRREVIH